MADIDTSSRDTKDTGGVLGSGRKKRRVGVHMDMTPMVDIAFLLLIFFMVTTVFRQPLAMEINLPESDATVQVPESNVMTLFVDAAEVIYMRLGTQPFTVLERNDLVSTFETQGDLNAELIVLAKIHRDARYENMVDLMDALEDARMERFSLIPMDEDDLKELEGLQ